jgi:hypothetical protein
MDKHPFFVVGGFRKREIKKRIIESGKERENRSLCNVEDRKLDNIILALKPDKDIVVHRG